MLPNPQTSSTDVAKSCVEGNGRGEEVEKFSTPKSKPKLDGTTSLPPITPRLMKTEDQSEAYEEEHVHSVYEQIASHFSSTRYKVYSLESIHAHLTGSSHGRSLNDF